MPAVRLESKIDSNSLAQPPQLKIVRYDESLEARERLRPSPPRLIWLVGFTVLGLLAFRFDLAVMTNLPYVDLPGDIGRLVDYAEVFGHGVGVLLFCLLAGALDVRGARISGYLAAHAFGAGLCADVFKLFFARLRPHHATELMDSFAATMPHLQTPSAATLVQEIRSFPSGHAAVAAGLAIGMSRLYPKGTYLFALFAGLATLQRVTATAHYPSDCLVGVAAAFAAGYGFYHGPVRLHERLAL